MIIVLDKLQPEVYLETFKERVTSPFPSNYVIIVKGNRYVEKCRVYYADKQLSALDPTGVARYELPLPRDGVLNFRIPEAVSVDNESMVEVRDGDRSITRDQIRINRGRADKRSVSDRHGLWSVDSYEQGGPYPASIEFTNSATFQKFLAVVTSGKYSIQLPNRESYQAAVSWTKIPGNQTGTAQAGTLKLNANDYAYSFDVSW